MLILLTVNLVYIIFDTHHADNPIVNEKNLAFEENSGPIRNALDSRGLLNL
jgi:hypothetical protein